MAMGCGGSKEAAIDLATVARNPAAFVLILSGHHDHPACNGTYVYDLSLIHILTLPTKA